MRALIYCMSYRVQMQEVSAANRIIVFKKMSSKPMILCSEFRVEELPADWDAILEAQAKVACQADYLPDPETVKLFKLSPAFDTWRILKGGNL
jgi:hypothetical protein